MTNEEMQDELNRLSLAVATLQVERRAWQFAFMGIVATHPRRDDCLFLLNHYVEAHLQASDTGQALPEAAKAHIRSFVGSLQDVADPASSEQVQELRAQAFPWLKHR